MHLRDFVMAIEGRAERAEFRRELAARAGVSKTTIWCWEHRLFNPSPKHFLAIAAASGGLVTMEAMYGESITPP